jgi:hypothetical protein
MRTYKGKEFFRWHRREFNFFSGTEGILSILLMSLLTSSLSVTWCYILLRMKPYCYIICSDGIDNQWDTTFSIIAHIYWHSTSWFLSRLPVCYIQNWNTFVMQWDEWKEESIFCVLYLYGTDGQWSYLYSFMGYISTKIIYSSKKMTYFQEMNECLGLHWDIQNTSSLPSVTYARHMRTLPYHLHLLLNG